MPRRRAFRLAACAALGLGVAAGCSGYHWVRTNQGLGSVHRVAVKAITNESYEPGVETLFTQALRREFSQRGDVTLVSDPQQADLVISGELLDLITFARSFSAVAFGLEYQVEVHLVLRAMRRDGTAIPIDQSAMHEWELYLTSADVEAERKNRQEALRRLSMVIASRVHEALADRLSR